MQAPEINTGVAASGNMLEGKRANYHVTAETFRLHAKSMYQDPWTAVFRELLTNAADQYIRSNKPDGLIEVFVPTEDSPYFIFRDYATGIPDPDRMLNVYFAFNNSDKREENSQTGRMGIGAKAVFAVSDQYEVISHHGTQSAVYHAYVDEEGFPCIRGPFYRENEKPERVGLEIRIPAGTDTSVQNSAAVSNQRIIKLKAVIAAMAHPGSPYTASYVTVCGLSFGLPANSNVKVDDDDDAAADEQTPNQDATQKTEKPGTSLSDTAMRMRTAAVAREMVGTITAAVKDNHRRSWMYGNRSTRNAICRCTTDRASFILTAKNIIQAYDRYTTAHADYAGSMTDVATKASKVLDDLAETAHIAFNQPEKFRRRAYFENAAVYLGNIAYSYDFADATDIRFESNETENADKHNDFLDGRTLRLFINTEDPNAKLPPVQWVPSRESLISTTETDAWIMSEYQELLVAAIQHLSTDMAETGKKLLEIWYSPGKLSHHKDPTETCAKLVAAAFLSDLVRMLLRSGYRGLATEPRLAVWAPLSCAKNLGDMHDAVRRAVAVLTGNAHIESMLSVVSLQNPLPNRIYAGAADQKTNRGELDLHGNWLLRVAARLQSYCRTDHYKTAYLAIVGPGVMPLKTLHWLTGQYVQRVTMVKANCDADVATLKAAVELYRQTVEAIQYDCDQQSEILTYLKTPEEALGPKKKRGKKADWLDPVNAKKLLKVRTNQYSTTTEKNTSVEYSEIMPKSPVYAYAEAVSNGEACHASFIRREPYLFVQCPMFNKKLRLPAQPDNSQLTTQILALLSSQLSATSSYLDPGTKVTLLCKPMRKHADKFDGYFADVAYFVAREHFSQASVRQQLAIGLGILSREGSTNLTPGDTDTPILGDVGRGVLLRSSIGVQWSPMEDSFPWFKDPLNAVLDQKLAGARQQYMGSATTLDWALEQRIADEVFYTVRSTSNLLRAYVNFLEDKPNYVKQHRKLAEQDAAMTQWCEKNYHPPAGDLQSWCHMVVRYYVLRYPLLGYAMQLDKAEKRPDTSQPRANRHARQYVTSMQLRWDARRDEDAFTIAEQESLFKQIVAKDITVVPQDLPPEIQLDLTTSVNAERVRAVLKWHNQSL